MNYMEHLPTLFLLTGLIACEKVSKTDHTTAHEALKEVYVRRQQRTVRFDCNGSVISDKVETINSVSKTYLLKPAISKDLWSFSASNLTTGSGGGGLWFSKGQFTLDLAPTVFHMKANEGLNKINWKFSYCSKRGEENECLESPTVKEQGTMFFDIIHKRILEPGVREIIPSVESCNNT